MSKKKSKSQASDTSPLPPQQPIQTNPPRAIDNSARQNPRQQQSFSPRSQQQRDQAPRPQRRSTLRWVLSSRALQLLVIGLLIALPSYYFYNQGKKVESQTNSPAQNNLQTTAEVVKQVSKHILLPSGEQPTVATVSDASKVRNQAFFTNAASGDKVLVYAQAKKAYLYRPSIDRMIEVAPLAPNKTTP
ncbi:MAG TPA: hypothetical protein VF575_03160 [Candidatus Saccharimonadales bacterium]|jgi:hypothetical protein